jgi:hypothetical protein
MKVITPGRPQTGWAKEFTCTGAGNADGGGCGAMLLVEQDDLYETSSGHYDGSTDHYVTFRCSACGVETDIKDVPSSVKNNIISKEAWMKKQGLIRD